MSTAENIDDSEEVKVENVAPPERFNFMAPDQWPEWRKQFEQYIQISGQSTKSEQEKLNLLYNAMGKKFEAHRWSDDEEMNILSGVKQVGFVPETLQEGLDKFDSYFNSKINITFARYNFNSRVQREDETIDDYITDLRALAESCDYRSLKEELIRDRIVVGMLNTKVSGQMRLNKDLTLNIAAETARQAEIRIQRTQKYSRSQSVLQWRFLMPIRKAIKTGLSVMQMISTTTLTIAMVLLAADILKIRDKSFSLWVPLTVFGFGCALGHFVSMFLGALLAGASASVVAATFFTGVLTKVFLCLLVWHIFSLYMDIKRICTERPHPAINSTEVRDEIQENS